jgi:uncharacterized protein
MKYVIVFAVLMAGFWLWRHRRDDDAEGDASTQKPVAPPRKPAGLPQTMVPCAQCGLHLPLQDSVKGSQGRYCSALHRQQSEG